MATYSIYEAKTQLSKLLKRVKQGSEILITDRGTPIAKLIPHDQTESFETRIERLSQHGKILAPRSQNKFPKGIARKGGLQRFLEDRD